MSLYDLSKNPGLGLRWDFTTRHSKPRKSEDVTEEEIARNERRLSFFDKGSLPSDSTPQTSTPNNGLPAPESTRSSASSESVQTFPPSRRSQQSESAPLIPLLKIDGPTQTSSSQECEHCAQFESQTQQWNILGDGQRVLGQYHDI